ncbi:AFG2-interacting ribosome maturation factor isoform X1 [Pogona vitticeps]
MYNSSPEKRPCRASAWPSSQVPSPAPGGWTAAPGSDWEKQPCPAQVAWRAAPPAAGQRGEGGATGRGWSWARGGGATNAESRGIPRPPPLLPGNQSVARAAWRTPFPSSPLTGGPDPQPRERGSPPHAPVLGRRMDPEGLACPHPVHSALRKCFHDLREQNEGWKRTLAACTPLFASLANLAEQMRALRKVAFGKSPLRGFPDLPERLGRKQRGAVEALLEELHQDKLQELQKVRDAVAVRVSGVSLLCEQLGDELVSTKAFQRSALWPSLAEMLEWLLDAEAFYHHVYLEVKLLLLQASCEDLAGLQALPAAWAQALQHGQQSVVEDVLLKVCFFLEAP